MELKLSCISHTEYAVGGFNRTFMELKSRSESPTLLGADVLIVPLWN